MIIIYGDVKPKKNSKHMVTVNRGGKSYTVPISSSNFKEWHKQALKELKTSCNVQYEVPCVIEMTFYKPTLRKYDLSNMAESIMDLLVDAKIIPDDNVTWIPRLILNHGGKDKDEPRCELTIRPID